jgi:hypothetical protein
MLGSKRIYYYKNWHAPIHPTKDKQVTFKIRNMRRVTFKDYDSVKKEWIEGEGVFHQWGNSFTEFESGPGNFTFAIVEDDNGKIWEVTPRDLKFIDQFTPANF